MKAMEMTYHYDRADAIRDAYSPSESFWNQFLSEYYNRKPGVFDCPQLRPILTHQELMAQLPDTVDACLSAYDRTLRLYIGGRLSRGWPDEVVLSRIRSTDCDDYFALVAKGCNTQSVGLIINDFARHNRELWLRLRVFVSGLQRRVGLPARLLHSGLFAGNYRQTPFGIHRDPSGGFMFAVHGRKTMLLWPPGYFERKGVVPIGGAIFEDPQNFAQDAIELTIEPGQMMYWPLPYWHVGLARSDGGHAAVTLGDWHVREHSVEMSKIVEHVLVRKLGQHNIRTANWPQVGGLPADIDSFAELLEVLASEGDFRSGLEDSWMKQASAGGFQKVPELLMERQLTKADYIRLQFPLYWKNSGRELSVYANGHCHRAKFPLGTELLNELGKMKWTSVIALGREISVRDAKHERQVIDLLSFLYQASALERRQNRPNTENAVPQ